MSSGIYGNNLEIVERFVASAAAGTIAQPFVAPCDIEVMGMAVHVGTAPGGASTVIVNVSDFPTSQNPTVSAYNLWTATNVPTILGAAVNSFTTAVVPTVIRNLPYALNYPLPGPSGATGFVTAQALTQTTQTPVTAPPTLAKYSMGPMIVPDNTYADFNGVTQPANIVHAGDILSFVISGTTGSAANVALSLYTSKA